MKGFVEWCKQQNNETVGEEFNHLCWQLGMLHDRYEKETQATTFYIYKDYYISDSEEGIDDIIFNYLSQRREYPNEEQVAEAWECDGQKVNLTAKELWKLLNVECYKTEVK